jgi:hypothetical protein
LLTPANIKAMRAADEVVLRFDPENPGSVELQKERERPDGFGEDVARVHIDARAIVTNYGNHPDADDPDAGRLQPAIGGTWVLTSAQVSPAWATIAALARADDEVSQIWLIDNRNSLLHRAQLTLHSVALRLERPTKRGTKFMHFNLASCVRSPHGLADMVTRHQG